MKLSRRLLSSFFAVSAISLPVVAIPGRTLHQHVEPRAILDLCVNIDAFALASVDLILPASVFEACLDICLCLSALPVVLKTNVDLQLLVETYGEDLVSGDLISLINSAPGGQHCRYPDHSKPVCSPDNPCDFDCEPPYVKKGNHCVCAPPYTLCNGVCGTFSYGCGSSAAQPYYKRNLSPDVKARAHGIFTHDDALATCAKGEEVCGVYQGSAAFECLNTDTTLESCGGCMSPNPFLFMSEQGPEGVDCTTLPYARNVRCSRGRCVIDRCDKGFVPSSKRDSCIRDGFYIQPFQL